MSDEIKSLLGIVVDNKYLKLINYSLTYRDMQLKIYVPCKFEEVLI